MIPVSFNKNKMKLNASGCSVRSAMKRHMPPQCIPEVHRIYFSFEMKMKRNLMKIVTIAICDLSSTCTGLKCNLQLPDVYSYRVLTCIFNTVTMIPIPACKYIACLNVD